MPALVLLFFSFCKCRHDLPQRLLDRTVVVNAVIGKALIARPALFIHRAKAARGKGTTLARKLVKVAPEPEDDAVLVQGSVVFLARHAAAARGDDQT